MWYPYSYKKKKKEPRHSRDDDRNNAINDKKA